MAYCRQYAALTVPGEELSQLVADAGLLLQVAAVLRLGLCFLELWGGQSHSAGMYRTPRLNRSNAHQLKKGVPV